MTKYDYLQAIKDDIQEYIKDNYSENEIRTNLENRDEWQEKLNDDLWVDDSITGNASGSYTFNTYKAEEYIAHNLDLLAEAMEEFGCNGDVLKNGAEWCDVTIRCYLLNRAIAEVLDELENEYFLAF